VDCEQCGKPATVHQTTLVQNEKRELHLCRDCAEASGIIRDKEISLPAVVQSLIGQHLGPEMDELSRLECPACGIRYMEFRAEGRLGCPEDYNVFRGGLDPLLYRIHRGTRHAGKSPRRRPPAAMAAEAASLRRKMREAVEAEDYAEAARIRDLLRTKEAADEPG
jgi:protein arginine kinase activator